jgi:hypothetical protein
MAGDETTARPIIDRRSTRVQEPNCGERWQGGGEGTWIKRENGRWKKEEGR